MIYLNNLQIPSIKIKKLIHLMIKYKKKHLLYLELLIKVKVYKQNKK